jgi:hypothetical protein
LSVDKSVQSFGYQPYIIDPSTYAEISASEIAAKGYSFRDSEQGIDDNYQTEPFKKKRIYEASTAGAYPFVAWKLVGLVHFPAPHSLAVK